MMEWNNSMKIIHIFKVTLRLNLSVNLLHMFLLRYKKLWKEGINSLYQ